MQGWDEFARAYNQAETISTREQATPVEREILLLLADIQEVVTGISQSMKSVRSMLVDTLRMREK